MEAVAAVVVAIVTAMLLLRKAEGTQEVILGSKLRGGQIPGQLRRSGGEGMQTGSDRKQNSSAREKGKRRNVPLPNVRISEEKRSDGVVLLRMLSA